MIGTHQELLGSSDCDLLVIAGARVQVTLNNLTKNGAGTKVALTPIAPPLAMFASWVARLWSRLAKYRHLPRASIVCNLPTDGSMALYCQVPFNDAGYEAIAADKSRKLLIELPIGMFKQHRALPLHILLQLVVELTLGPAPLAFSEATADWSLSDVALLGTRLHVDVPVATQCDQHIDSGHKLAAPFQSVVAPRHI